MNPPQSGQAVKTPWNGVIQAKDEQFQMKRRAVLREAGRAFSRFGFHNVALEDVAEALNVSKPTLYRYFTNKHEMLYECHKMALEFGDQSIRVAKDQGGSGLDHVMNFIRHYVESLGGELGALAVLSDQFALPPDQLAEIRAKRADFDHVFRAWISRGIEDGSIRPCDPTIAVACFMGAINWLPVWYSSEGSLTADEVAAGLVDIFANGLDAAGRTGRQAGCT